MPSPGTAPTASLDPEPRPDDECPPGFPVLDSSSHSEPFVIQTAKNENAEGVTTGRRTGVAIRTPISYVINKGEKNEESKW